MTTIPISNRYDLLTTREETPIKHQKKQTDKRNASERSPIDIEPSAKIHRDYNDNNSDRISDEDGYFPEVNPMQHQETRNNVYQQ